jgi:hypothetical protein
VAEPKTNGAVDIEINPDSVKWTRKTLGLTVDSFAWLLGVSPSSIFRYESTGVPTVHHGTLTRKINLLNHWLGRADSAETTARLLMVKDGAATLAGLLEMGGALMIQDQAETRIGGARGPQSKAAKADSARRAAKADSAKAGAAKGGSPGGEPSAEGAPITLPLGELAKRGFRAFNLAASVMDPDGEGQPVLSRAESPPGPSRMEVRARELEAEACLIEAEARKLEAEARKLEAERRVARAKEGDGPPRADS